MSLAPALLGRREIRTADAMEDLGRRIGEQLRPGDLLILTGPLGAGKTTFTRGLADGLGVRGPVQSPTFVIARTHPSLVGGAPLVHVDAYRLGSAAELDDLDIDFTRSVVVIEWGRPMASAVADAWRDDLGQREGAVQVDLQDPLPRLPRGVEEVAELCDRGTVDQREDRLGTAVQLRAEAGEVGCVGDVRGDELDTVRVVRTGGQIDDGEGILRVEVLDQGRSDPGGTPGDDDPSAAGAHVRCTRRSMTEMA